MESRTNSVKYINVLRNYQMIKLWLLGKARKERIPNFERQYKELLGYDSITFHHQGKSYTFDRKTIEEKAVGPSKHCERCAALQLAYFYFFLNLRNPLLLTCLPYGVMEYPRPACFGSIG